MGNRGARKGMEGVKYVPHLHYSIYGRPLKEKELYFALIFNLVYFCTFCWIVCLHFSSIIECVCVFVRVCVCVYVCVWVCVSVCVYLLFYFYSRRHLSYYKVRGVNFIAETCNAIAPHINEKQKTKFLLQIFLFSCLNNNKESLLVSRIVLKKTMFWKPVSKPCNNYL